MATRAWLYRPDECQRPVRVQRQRVVEIDSDIAIGRADVGLGREGTDADGGAIDGEIGGLRILRERRVAEVAAQARDELIPAPGKLAERGQLQSETPASLIDGRAIVGRLIERRHAGVRIDRAVIVVHVAADVGVAEATVIGIAAEQNILPEEAAALRGQEGELVLVEVGKRVRLSGRVEPGHRERLRSLQRVVRERETHVEVDVVVLISDLAEKLLHPARIVVRPAFVVEEVPGHEIVDVVAYAAVFEFRGLPAKRTGRHLDGAAGTLRPAAGIDRQRASQRVEAERGIRAGNELDARNRRRRKQIPVDDVAECLVDPHAVLKHRQTLRGPEQRRGREAAKVEVLLIRIALRSGDADAVGVALEEVAQVERSLPQQIGATEALHVGRDILQRGAEAGQRGRADDLDLGQLENFRRIVGVRAGCRAGQRQ